MEGVGGSLTVSGAWLIIGDVSDALNIGRVTNVVKTGTYYLYERTWGSQGYLTFAGLRSPLPRGTESVA
ncbi:DUF2061 domain-containing protein [Halalkalicoccus subterraneus]|uniref:DUF2061 domain-containing protein n=1 Tax=Halalkalicoccus subterraneus TaxID=2675002 RepID=UPI001B882EE5|nr:DUF2061 domain-containing protein [Halalkalicoccus subterraneus]